MKKCILTILIIVALIGVMLCGTGCDTYDVDFDIARWPIEFHKKTPEPTVTPQVIYVPYYDGEAPSTSTQNPIK